MVIGLIGFKQVGKSTAAKYLEDKYGFVRHNFKDALVAEIKEKFPDLLREILERDREFFLDCETIDDLFAIKPPLMRALMQNYGTEVRRGDDPNYWVWKWNEQYIKGDAKNLVTDDVRFLNEAKVVKDANGTIIRLTRPDLLTGGDHQSETEQLQIVADHTIECEAGDFEKLYTELDRILAEVR